MSHAHPTYDEHGRTRPVDAIAWCQRCHQPIRYGQPYMPRIPMRGSWGGLDHAYCPPVLAVVQ